MNQFISDLKLYAKNMKVLVVEDDTELNDLLSQTLQMFFRVVDSAYNGQEGLDLYETNKHEIIISDINMPIMDGITFASKIKNINATQSIIMLSAHTEAEYFIKLIEIGVSAFSPKPYNPDNFIMILSREAENVMMRKEYEKIKFKELQEQLQAELSGVDAKASSLHTSLQGKIKQDVIKLKDNVEKIKQSNTQSSKLLEEFKSDNELWEMLKYEIDNIVYLNNDLEECTDTMCLKGLDDELIEEISEILQRYFNIFMNIPAFNIIARNFKTLSEILMDVKVKDLDSEGYNNLMGIEYILEDTKKFINDVFIEQKDIGYKFFENSLTASIEQIETALGLRDGNEVDFF